MASPNSSTILEMISKGIVGVDSAGGAVAATVTAIFNCTPDVESSTSAGPRRGMSSRRHRVDAVPDHPSMAIQVLDFLNATYMPAVIYLGLVGNVLSLIIFLFTKLRSRTSSLYMGALAVSDSGFLIVLSFAWLNERGINVYQHGLCLVTVFFTSVFACWSVWLTVSFTAERFVAVRYPLWKLQASSPSRRPRLVIGATAFLSLALNAPLLLIVRVGDGEHSDCSLHPEYESVLYYLNILDTVVTFIVPFLLITFMNFMIARAIYLFYLRYKKQRSVPDIQINCQDSSESSSCLAIPVTVDKECTVLCFNSDGTVTATRGGGIAHATQISITRMLLLVSTVFILLNLPSYVMRIYVFLLSLGHSELQDAEHNSQPYVLQRYFMLLYYTNFAINFVLYNASSRMFRVTLCEYMQGRWDALRESMVSWRPCTKTRLENRSCIWLT
ncbi:pyrokinin-1 receptor [Rhipicephalus sanguineus]|uniref:pyrokinin-1 receptor n=1 Tax=Rhipicephalus sanguineus TaxID=34632 RepID=UPI0020C5693D|nr:pyrokinin-1 receptor [Rhipicephalus sanguineus]